MVLPIVWHFLFLDIKGTSSCDITRTSKRRWGTPPDLGVFVLFLNLALCLLQVSKERISVPKIAKEARHWQCDGVY